MSSNVEIPKRKFNVPHTFVIIFTILIIVALATWVIPSGEYDRVKNAQGRTVVVANSFHFIKSVPAGIGDLFMAPLKGFTSKAEVAGFILIVGGAFAVIQRTNAINSGILKVVKVLKGREILLIPIVMTLFSIGGAVIGMAEETIPFAVIFVPLALALGYDSIVGMSLAFVGATVGFSSAMFNPFTVGIAKGIAETPIKAGLMYRTVTWAIFTIIAIAFVMWYANRVKKNPKLSVMYELDQKRREELHLENSMEEEFKSSHAAVLTTLLLGIGLIIYGVLKYEWYIGEIAAVFLGIGIAAGLIGGLSLNDIAETFILGAKDLIGAAMVVGLANAIVTLANEAKIMDTILYGLAKFIEPLPTLLSGYAMLIVQSIINFFVGSGTGQAALTIPIMYPLGELVGISRETSILIYQFGNGFTDLIFPTSGTLIATLGLARIPFEKWAKWVSKVLVMLFILQILFITPVILFPSLLN
ncbi:YfcC family protein [Fonticella tunisiensis]|uniref:Putative ion transporter superfamily protein YfcC n=1 Tax=Fonticella tunisiensis TaxID=1096341 RepID=A0A4R7KRQ6_9CLOT|nr:Na+/H+ antiporter NhaC family protein [Fonticella tunisiensis]TDT61303.1 putative ion transporter superfamily protein YfcC [Fonticella tunisiensis]